MSGPDTRCKDVKWGASRDADGNVPSSHAQLCVLMDIRDELKELNAQLRCQRFQRIPQWLMDMSAAVRRLDKRIAEKVKLR